MALFSPMDNPQEEYDIFVNAVSSALQPKNGRHHTYILDMRENSSKTQYYVNVLLDLLESKGYEIVDVQYQYAVSVYSEFSAGAGHVNYESHRHTAQRERSIMFLYK